MRKLSVHLFWAAASALMGLAPEVMANTLSEALQQGSKVDLNFRARFEDVTEDGLQDSDAMTLRSRLTYQSGVWHGFGFTAEFDDVSELGRVDYRAFPGDPQNPGTAVIADPENTEVNQSFLTYSTAATQAKLGRQRLIFDNARFVGNVGWRQNEQTYDAFSVVDKQLANTQVSYAYVWSVNRIFGDNNPLQPDHRMDSHLLNIAYTGFAAGKLIAYAYLLDNETAPAASSDTLGVRWQGRVSEMFSYNLEYAKQQDAGVAQAFEADYLLAEALLSLAGYSVTLGYESLGSDDGAYGFATPLATLHAFQGWADKFLATPAQGLSDLYLNIGARALGTQWLLSYHQFESDEGSLDFGSEIGLSAQRKFGPVAMTAKYADYASGEVIAVRDTRKFWLMAEWAF